MTAAGALSSPAAASPAAATPDAATAGTKRKRLSVSSEAASPVERPSRERRSVERYVNVSPRKTPPSKSITAEQGPGTKLKDIPNVFFKVSKRKADETLQALHTILFARRPSAHFMKRNIFQFSGFVWSADEVKQKMRVKEKLDKCNKDRLFDFCELLDIQIARATPKDEITAKLLEFLESPYTTRDVILSEKKKKSKHKKKAKGVSQTVTGGSSEKKTKKRKGSLETEAKKRKRHSAKDKKGTGYESLSEKENEDDHISVGKEDLDEEVSIDSTLPNADNDVHGTEQENDQAETMKEDDGDMPETLTVEKKSSENQKSTEIKIQEDLSANGDSDAKSDITTIPVPVKDSSDAEDVPDVPSPKKRGSLKGKPSSLSEPNAKDAAIEKDSVKICKTKSKSSPREASVDNGYSSPPLSSKSKKKDKKKGKKTDSPASLDNKLFKKHAAKSSAKLSTKEQGKKESSGKANAGPSKEEIRSVIIGILANVDFDTTTLADIIKQLGASFNKDLMDRKREVKQILEEEIDKMTKEESTEVDDDDSEDDGAGDGAK